MTMDQRSLEMTAGNAAKIAADLVQVAYGDGIVGVGEDALLEAFSSLHLKIGQRLIDNTNQLVAGNFIAEAFPGTSPVPQQAQPAAIPAINPQAVVAVPVAPQPAIVAPPAAVAPVAAVPVQAAPAGNVVPFPAAQPAPVAIPGVSSGSADPQVDEAALQLLKDFQTGAWQTDWEDNRAVKAADPSKRFPDFKHKTWKRPGSKYFVGVYLNDKKMSPEVAAQFRALGL